MSDFDDLRQMREAKERAQALAHQKALENEKRKAEVAQRLQERITASADRLHGIVVEILEELRDAIYPYLAAKRLDSGNWGVVREGPNEYDGCGSDEYAAVVAAEFDKRGEAKRFVSYKGLSRYRSRLIPSNLTRQDLVHALKKLHPHFSLFLRRFPVLAPMLLVVACTVAPADGQEPKEPTPAFLTLSTSDASEIEMTLTNTLDSLAPVTPPSRATAVRPTATPTKTTAATVTRAATRTPSSTATSSPEQAIVAEQSTSLITCTNTVIRRQGPGTNFSQVGTCQPGETIDLATIKGKTVAGGYTWFKVESSAGQYYYIAVISSRMTFNQQSINALRILPASELPTRQPTTPVRQVTTTVKKVTITPDYFLFMSPGKDQNGTSVGSQTLAILETSGPWLKVDYPGLGVRWVHSANLVISSGTTSSVPLQTNPEVISAEIGNTNPYFSGIKSESGRVYAEEVDIRSGMISPWLYDSGGYLCQSPVQSVLDNPEETNFQHTFGTPVLFPYIGIVTSISPPDSGGSFTVSFTDQNGVQSSRTINPSTRVYFQTAFYNGNTGCVDPNLQSPPISFFAVGRAVGFAEPGTNYVMGAYR